MNTILVVDDSRFMRTTVEHILDKVGYQVAMAVDGEEALRIANDILPDAVLLDLLLPKIGGPEVLRCLKTNPVTADIPVVVVTGLSQKNEGKLRKAGAFAYLEKGTLFEHPQILLELVDAALKPNGGLVPPVQSIASPIPLRNQ
ncbi:MAG TPA: response regulator [Candidatus Angelobacter sp.]|nr:response regulator [Candidatus Angelobacter sp.]